MDQISIPVPSSLDEIESLVNQLYQPNSPATISRIQEVLQAVQRSSDGWRVADGLLARQGDNVKFFAVLTIMVKLNTEAISDGDARSVLENLIGWLLKSMENGAGAMVLRKLCSALVTHFVQFSHLWPWCIKNMVYCLYFNRTEVLENSRDAPHLEDLLSDFNEQKWLTALWFTAALAEEAEKTDSKSTKYIGLHERLAKNSADLKAVLGHLFSSHPNLTSSRSRSEAVSCLQAWVMYAQRVPSQILMENLRSPVASVIKGLVVHTSDFHGPAIELITDTLSNWQALFTSDDYDTLYALLETEKLQAVYNDLLQGDFDFDAVKVGLFLIAFGDAQMTELMNKDNRRAQSLLAGLARILTAPGCPYVDDKIFVPALEFWSQFMENIVDHIYSETDGQADWQSPPLSHMMEVVSHCWKKIQYPDIETYASWDSTERVGFGDARKDVADLLQSMYAIPGQSLISIFVNLTIQSLSSLAWADLESSAFCLGSLSDCVSDGIEYDAVLSKVFGSSLFDMLRQGHSAVPVRARQTCLSLIERYSEYFGRYAEYLPAALNLLFSAVNDQPLAASSSKSIHRLCSSCRTMLTSEVGAFLGHYDTLRQSQVLDSLVEERIVGAVAAIIQAVPDEQQRLEAFKRLILLGRADFERCIEMRSLNDTMISPTDPMVLRAFDANQRPLAAVSAKDVSSGLAVRYLRCLLGIAKGLQAPAEATIDLDDEKRDPESKSNKELRSVQQDLMGILARMKDTFADSSEALTIICSIIRAGFSETESGPFLFDPNLVTDFLTSPWYGRVASAVTAASVFVNSLHNVSGKEQIAEVLRRLLPWALSLIQQLQEPEDDPELAQYAIEFAQRAMTKRPDIFLATQPANLLEYLFVFSIKLLNGSEPLPKYAAAEFWSNFIVLRTDDPSTQEAFDGAVAQLGPMLAHSLTLNIGGNASRSDLDKLCDPLKKIVVQSPQARQWLEAALNDASFPSEKVSHDDKALFLKKIISLRGSRATNQIVREFWLACRGSNFAYAS